MNTLENPVSAPAEPAKKSVAAVMVSELFQHRKKSEALEDLIFELRGHLENFESGSAEIWQGKFWVNLHCPKSIEAAKDFCRAWGGVWTQKNDSGSVSYHGKDDRGDVHIHRVEACKEAPLSL